MELLTAPTPTPEEMFHACRRAADVLGVERAFRLGNRHYFALGAGWQIALSAESGMRVQIQGWHHAECRATFFARIEDHERLAGLLASMKDEIGARVGA